VRKPFSPILHKEFDEKAKNLVIKALKVIGLQYKKNTDDYGIDLVPIDTNRKSVEVEVKNSWKGIFPYDTLHITSRKGKWRESTIFVVVSGDYKTLAIVRGELLDKLITKDTLYTEDEQFFEVPVSEVKFWRLTK
jgi:hypothetical protein